jgi:Lsr2
MVRETIVRLIDDIDGKPAKETVTFSLDGVGYEIDLNARNADKLRKIFTPYVEKARKIGARRPGRSARRAGVRSTHHRERAAQIRAWAKQHGIEVNERGRIPSRIAEAYETGDPRMAKGSASRG